MGRRNRKYEGKVKVMKKVLKIIVLLIILLLILLPIYILFMNNIIAYNTKRKLEKTELPENTAIIDSISIAGKVTGNGNGMQYFGAILIKTDLSENELNQYYKRYRENDWSFIIHKQNSSKIDVIDCLHYEFKKYNDNEKDKYYIIYSFGSAKNVFLGDILEEFDIRGH